MSGTSRRPSVSLSRAVVAAFALTSIGLVLWGCGRREQDQARPADGPVVTENQRINLPPPPTDQPTLTESEEAEQPVAQVSPTKALLASEGAASPSPSASPAGLGLSPRSPFRSQPGSQAGENYAKVAENRVIDAREDNRATFSLDVDTASYTIMRRDLTNGRLPVPESVRVEEFVNFFDYGDEPPSGAEDAPFAIHLESSPSPFGEGQYLLRVGVQATEVPAEQRPSANLVFLIDVSGSMSAANKLDLVQFALSTLVNTLRPDDSIGIVVYAGRQAVVLPPTPVLQRGAILEAISSLQAGGSTNGEAGIRTAYNLAAQHLRPGGINRVILCTDGDFNVGVTGDDLIHLIEQERDRGITLTTLGFGMGNYNDHDMERLADRGNGNYAYIDSRNEALRVLGRDLGGTLQVIAKDVKVQLIFNTEAVASFRLIGYENRVLAHQDFENDAVDAAEIGSGQFVTAYVELRLRPGVSAGTDPRQLVQVRVRYKAPDGNRSMEVGRDFNLAQMRTSFEQASPVFRFGSAVAEFAEILRHSEHSQRARFADVERIAREARWSGSPDAGEFLELVSMASRLWPQQSQ
jgi:Ca-activated chloride channel family protein